MLSSSLLHCSLTAFVIYSLVFQVHKGHSALLKVTGPSGPITVAKGKNVVLPCHFFAEQNAQDTEVIWFREQFSPFVHRYKGGQDQYGEQMPQYQGRTELLKEGLTKGSVHLKIFHVQPSDTGSYTCFVRRGSDYDEAVVELKVTEPFSQGIYPWMIALGMALVAVVALLGLTVHQYKIKDKQAKELAWRRDAVPIEEVNVVLDPNTAHRDLVLSEDRKSVKRDDKPQDLPYIDQRFKHWCCVLGRDGFNSGRHYWEVEVVNGSSWIVGVSREDVKKEASFDFKPEEGIWSVGNWEGHFKAYTSPDQTLLPEIKTPKRIRISLDYEGRRVAFFSVDEGITIFTFTLASFNKKKVHPFLWLGPGTCLKIWP